MCLLGALCRDTRVAGDSAREEGFLDAFDGGGGVRAERCLACSSAILESIAPFRRYKCISTLLLDPGITNLKHGELFPSASVNRK